MIHKGFLLNFLGRIFLLLYLFEHFFKKKFECISAEIIPFIFLNRI